MNFFELGATGFEAVYALEVRSILRLERQLGDSRAAAGTNPVAFKHRAVALARGIIAAFLMAFAALQAFSASWFKRQFRDGRSAAATLPVSLMHKYV